MWVSCVKADTKVAKEYLFCDNNVLELLRYRAVRTYARVSKNILNPNNHNNLSQ